MAENSLTNEITYRSSVASALSIKMLCINSSGGESAEKIVLSAQL